MNWYKRAQVYNVFEQESLAALVPLCYKYHYWRELILSKDFEKDPKKGLIVQSKADQLLPKITSAYSNVLKSMKNRIVAIMVDWINLHDLDNPQILAETRARDEMKNADEDPAYFSLSSSISFFLGRVASTVQMGGLPLNSVEKELKNSGLKQTTINVILDYIVQSSNHRLSFNDNVQLRDLRAKRILFSEERNITSIKEMFNSFPEIFTFDHYEKDEEGNEIEKKAILSSLSELENYTGDDDILEHVDNYFQMHWKYPRRKELAKKFIQKIVAEIWQKITLPLFRISFEQIPSEKNQLTLRKIIDLAKRSFQQLQSSNTLEQLMSNVNATLNVVHYGGNLILDHFEDYEMNNEIKQVETLDNYLSAKYLSRLSSREFEDQWKQELLDYIVENYHLEEEELSQNQ